MPTKHATLGADWSNAHRGHWHIYMGMHAGAHTLSGTHECVHVHAELTLHGPGRSEREEWHAVLLLLEAAGR